MRPRRPRGAGRLAVTAVLLAGCAKPESPPGGPADVTTPQIVAVSPGPGEVGVGMQEPLVVTFSKKIDASTAERALWIAPGGAVKPRIEVQGAVMVIHLGRPFSPDTTIGVLLTTAIRDRKREWTQNTMTEPYRWVFSTGDSLWPGEVRGKIQRVGAAAQGMVFVAVYPGEADTVPDPRTTEPLAVTQARMDDSYLLSGLPVDGRRRWLVPLYDRDGNQEVGGRSDFVSAEVETLVLTAASPRVEMPLRLVNPEAPGEVHGSLTREAGDSSAVWIEARSEGSEELRAAARARLAPDGTFALLRLAPGRYELSALCDRNEDGTADPGETRHDLGPAIVRPGETVEIGSRPLPACPAAGGD